MLAWLLWMNESKLRSFLLGPFVIIFFFLLPFCTAAFSCSCSLPLMLSAPTFYRRSSVFCKYYIICVFWVNVSYTLRLSIWWITFSWSCMKTTLNETTVSWSDLALRSKLWSAPVDVWFREAEWAETQLLQERELVLISQKMLRGFVSWSSARTSTHE